MVEDFSIFFNSSEFAVDATIGDRPITGLKGHTAVKVNDVETQKTTFTCASALILNIGHGERLFLNDQTYLIVGIQPDGTGLTTLILEKVN